MRLCADWSHPEIRLSQNQRGRVNYVATVTNQGTVRFMVHTSKFTGSVYIEFLERLLRTSERKLFLIADCLQCIGESSLSNGLQNIPTGVNCSFYRHILPS
nr:transposase [Adonisia turfae]